MDVNIGEGFNLRRDVVMRVMTMIRKMNVDHGEGAHVLVLPAFYPGYHWQSRDIEQSRIPWKSFFDVESINRYVPVMELEEFMSNLLAVMFVHFINRRKSEERIYKVS